MDKISVAEFRKLTKAKKESPEQGVQKQLV